jgi:uncharacterized protein (DUF924 family)
MSSPDDILAFWFTDSARWFKKDPAFDAEICDRFAPLHAAIERGAHEQWLESPRGTVAYVIVLDQFSRNMFRGTSLMFASDARALAAARRAIDGGQDKALDAAQRSFLYMPFVHSEDIADPKRIGRLSGIRRRSVFDGSQPYQGGRLDTSLTYLTKERCARWTPGYPRALP